MVRRTNPKPFSTCELRSNLSPLRPDQRLHVVWPTENYAPESMQIWPVVRVVLERSFTNRDCHQNTHHSVGNQASKQACRQRSDQAGRATALTAGSLVFVSLIQ